MPSDQSVVLEEHASEIKLRFGVVIASFYDPPQAHYEGAPQPVRRWRVRLPKWFPEGSWLHQEHAYASLADALSALDETGSLDAIEAMWRAQSDQARARQHAFSKLMAAHVRCDRSYDELRRARQQAALDQMQNSTEET